MGGRYLGSAGYVYVLYIHAARARTVFRLVFASLIALVSLPKSIIAIVFIALKSMVGFGHGPPCSIIQKDEGYTWVGPGHEKIIAQDCRYPCRYIMLTGIFCHVVYKPLPAMKTPQIGPTWLLDHEGPMIGQCK